LADWVRDFNTLTRLRFLIYDWRMERVGERIVKSYAVATLAVCGLMMGAAMTKAAGQLIYDEQADARRDIAAAISQASKTGRNIVLIFGANW
jgi:hypothetical protein